MDIEKPPVDDHEAKMARADLYKLATYSAKLFKLIDENDELDGWVQAKITKASDYISSVYHYMEYEQIAKAQMNSAPESFEEELHNEIKENLTKKWLDTKKEL